MLNENEEIIY